MPVTNVGNISLQRSHYMFMGNTLGSNLILIHVDWDPMGDNIGNSMGLGFTEYL